jgi:predicted metal-dependent hydrolase
MEIKYSIRYSSRRTLGISILRDGSVVVRAPYRTSRESIEKMVRDKASWILKHTTNIRSRLEKNLPYNSLMVKSIFTGEGKWNSGWLRQTGFYAGSMMITLK